MGEIGSGGGGGGNGGGSGGGSGGSSGGGGSGGSSGSDRCIRKRRIGNDEQNAKMPKYFHLRAEFIAMRTHGGTTDSKADA